MMVIFFNADSIGEYSLDEEIRTTDCDIKSICF